MVMMATATVMTVAKLSMVLLIETAAHNADCVAHVEAYLKLIRTENPIGFPYF